MTKMIVKIVNDPAQVRVDDGDPEKKIEGTAYILREDVETAKEFARELMKEDNAAIRRRWEHDYYKQVKEQYCSAHVAGALLMKVWEWTKKEDDDGQEML